MIDKKNLANIILILFKLKVIFFAMQASFTSYKSLFSIGSIDKEILTITLISSVFIFNNLSGVQSNFIVSATPCNTSSFRINNCNIAYHK